MAEFKYNHLIVPDDPKENAAWRAQTLEYARNGPKFRQAIIELCRKDFWYWVKGFAYVHEARILDDDSEDLNTKVSFLPWPHQVPVVNRILKVLGKKDLRVVKSRAQGASWILVLIFIWCWLFKKGFKGNLVSKDEQAVDRRNDMDSLMAKMDWLLEKLPVWMVGVKNRDWRRNYGEHYLARMDGETAITGYSCTADVASGGRAMVFGMDEHAKHPSPQDRQALAATQPITRCRIFISTPKGKTGAYAEIVHDDTIEEPVLYLSWRDNPTQNRGLYRIVKGNPVAVDEQKYGPLFPEYQDHGRWIKLKERLIERGYDLTSDATRSRWYDEECLRPGANSVLVAQEYDMAFGAEGAQYFAEGLINRLKSCVRRPLRGEFTINPESLVGKWSDNVDGRFKLWFELDIRGNPPMGEYVVSADVCSGIGGSMTSNSAVSVLNRRTGEKVASFASPSVIPYELAEICIALCRWFCNYRGDPAFLIWEANGYGSEFTRRVERSNFNNYYRRKTKDSPLHSRHTDKAGYWTYKRSILLGPYREALLEGYFDNPEYEAIEELGQYQMGQDGEPYHVGETDKQDPAGAKAAHGDRCFVKGTMIQTESGESPIEQIAVGDRVWTRSGLRSVVACGQTGVEQVFDVELSNGRVLTGTGDHPIWTQNRAWVPLLSLTPCDILVQCHINHKKEMSWVSTTEESTSVVPTRKPSYSTVESITETLTPGRNIGDVTFGGERSLETEVRSRCMWPFGSTITALFQRAMWFITRTITRATTTFQILRASLFQSTARFMKPEDAWTHIDTKGFIGILANSAVANMCHGESQKLDSVTRSVRRNTYASSANSNVAGSDHTYVSGVARSTRAGEKSRLDSVAESVDNSITIRSVRRVAERLAVYNLSVSDAPEYFAEGVLVHNCISDALAWEASVHFGDQMESGHRKNKPNVMNATEDNVPRESFAWRRAQYLKMIRKQKQESAW